MVRQHQDRNGLFYSNLYIERAVLTTRIIPILMSLAALFAIFFLGVYNLLGRPRQWFIMLGSMVIAFCLFTIAYILARMRRTDMSVYLVVLALNLLGAGGAVALQGWFAMSVLLAYVGLASARLFTRRPQNWIVLVITTISVIGQILLTNFFPMPKYTNPVIIQVLLWSGYAISGIFVVGYISDIQDQTLEQLFEKAGETANQLQLQTSTLETQTEILQRRTDFLVTVIKIIKDLDHPRFVSDMVNMIVRSVQKEFGFYHVAYYGITDPLSPAVLLATAGETESELEPGFQVLLEATDPVAEVARLGRVYISSETDISGSHLPMTKSRATIPVGSSHTGVNGVLDIQDRNAGSFQEAELLLLQMLGEQVSLVLESTYRYERVYQRLDEVTRFSRENNLASWQEWIRPKSNHVYRYDKAQAPPSASPALPEKIDQSLIQEKYSIPLTTTQGEILGQVVAHKAHSWSTDEITLLKTLIEQVEQTLENARLFDATERRAVREQMTRRITDNIRSAVTVEEAIRRAVTHLAEAVDASEVTAQLEVMREMPAAEGEINA